MNPSRPTACAAGLRRTCPVQPHRLVWLLLSLLTGSHALAQTATVAAPFRLTTDAGVSVRIQPKRAYTIDRVWLNDQQVGQPNGNYGLVYHSGQMKWVGSGHDEGGVEEIQELALRVDGQDVDPSTAGDVTGRVIEFRKRSRVGALEVLSSIRLQDDRIDERADVRVVKPVSVHTGYAFMHCWTRDATEWMAREPGQEAVAGTFDNSGWEVRKDVRWLALFDPSREVAILTEFPPDLPAGEGIRHAVWDLEAYKKQYFQPWSKADLEAGDRFTFRMSVRLLPATSENWKDVVTSEAFRYEGGEHVAVDTTRANDPEQPQSETQRRLLERLPDIDPQRPPQWLTDPVAMAALDPDTVLEPWHPVRVEGQRIDVWGRSTTLGGWGLPRELISKDASMLASPIRLHVKMTDTAEPVAPPQAVRTAQHDGRVDYVATTHTRGSDISVRSTHEYDGFQRYRVELASDRPQRLDRLSLVIPIPAERALFMQHATAWVLGQSQQNTAVSQAVPEGDDEVYANRFTPFVWLGDYERGLSWFAESDQLWAPDQSQRAVRLVRRGKTVELHIDLIAEPTTLPPTATFDFGLMATPVKPLPDGWRGWLITTEDPRLRKFEGHDQRGDHVIFWYDKWRIVRHYPVPRDWGEFSRWTQRLHNTGAQRTYAYLDVTLMSRGEKTHIPDEDFVFIPPEWKAYGQDWINKPNYQNYSYLRASPASGWADFALASVKRWVTEGGVSGIYLDEAFPYADTDPAHGTGYDGPDGTRRPTWPLYATRAFHKRLAYLFQKYGQGPPALLSHTSATIAVPYLSFADIQLTGEQYFHDMLHWEGEGYPSYVEMARNERFHAEHRGTAFGLVPAFLPLYKPPHSKDYPQTITTAGPTREILAKTLVHDVLVWPNFCYAPPVLKSIEIKNRFGVGEPDTTFHGYWQEDAQRLVTDASPMNALTSYYQRPGQLLVIVSNTSPSPQTIHLDPSAVGPAFRSARTTDAETGEPLTVNQSLPVEVPGRDYRILLIEQNG